VVPVRVDAAPERVEVAASGAARCALARPGQDPSTMQACFHQLKAIM